MFNLTHYRTVLFDMDGVLYRGKQVLPGTRELLAFLDRQQIGYGCITNNSTMTSEQYAAKLAGMELAVPAAHVITSSLATNSYLRASYPHGTRVAVLGMGGLLDTLFSDDYFVLDEQHPELLVQGADFHLTYDRLKMATLAIRRGARYIATNPDRTFPSEEGLIPGAGAIGAALIAATDQQPFVVGKPAPTMFEVAVEQLAADPQTTLVIGDRLDTDILGANRAGLDSIMVLSGVSTRADLATNEARPLAVFDDLSAVLALWQAMVEH
jgi:4-nitrophenyl phosphatase